MLRCKAAADLATSASAMLVCQSGGIRFSPSASFICYPSQCPLNSGNAIIPRDSAPEPEVLPVITWLQSNLHAICFRCLHNVKLRFTFPHPLILNFVEQADLPRSNIRFRLDQAYVFSSNVCRFKTVKSLSVLDIFSPCLQLLSRRNPWLAQSTSFYLLLLSALCFTGSVGEGKKQRLFFHRNSC